MAYLIIVISLSPTYPTMPFLSSSPYLQCPYPLIGNGLECSNDTDLDGIPDSELNIGCDETVQSCLMVCFFCFRDLRICT